MIKEKNWYAVYTKPRWEKKVYGILQKKGIVSYCPLNKVSRKWSDRIKIVEEPLFKSYVFVQVFEDYLPQIRYVDGILNYVYWQGKPARIKNEEIETIQKFMSDYKDVEVLPIEIKPFDEVVINSGVLVGQKGIVTKILSNSAEVILESLGYKLVARFEKKNLVPFQKGHA